MSFDNVIGESFILIFTDFLLLYDNKYYLQAYLDNCACKVVNTQMIDYFDDNLFDDWILQMLYYDRTKLILLKVVIVKNILLSLLVF